MTFQRGCGGRGLLHLERRVHRLLHLSRVRQPSHLGRRALLFAQLRQHLVAALLRLPVLRSAGEYLYGPGGDGRVGAPFEEYRDRAGSPPRRREHERRLSPSGLSRIHVGAALHQRRDRLRAPRHRRQVQRRDPQRGECLGVGPRLEERNHHRPIPHFARHVQRRVRANAGDRLHVGPRANEECGQFDVAVTRCPVQRGHAVALRCVDIDALSEQRAHALHVEPHRRVGEGCGSHARRHGAPRHGAWCTGDRITHNWIAHKWRSRDWRIRDCAGRHRRRPA